MMGTTLYTSATPGPYEMGKADQVVEQIIRPTGWWTRRSACAPARGRLTT
jgi:excinuclease ABC subunit B